MKTIIYCRVSTDTQEEKGSSLQTQLEACLKYCQDKGYDVTNQFSETYSGLELERPELNKLRELVRNEEIDIVVVYCLDRLGRDPTHGVILTQEFEKYNVKLEAVIEDIDNSELGKLISYIRGYASKVETEKIKERTIRGKRARALSGKLPSGGGHKLYGYNYIKGKGVGEGIRYINEQEAHWVREMFRWLVEERLAINAITKRMRSIGIPTPAGSRYWLRQTIYRILSNPAYMGKTYAFTKEFVLPKKRNKPDSTTKKTGVIRKPHDQWVEIPGATPPIIEEETFNDAQAILKRNRELSNRNAKHQYLLSGYIYCGECGRRYAGFIKAWKDEGKPKKERYYRCPDNLSINNPNRCTGKQINAPTIEKAVWAEIENALNNPESVLIGLENNRKADTTHLLKEKETITAQIESKEKERDRIHQAFYVTGNEAKFRKDIKGLDNSLQSLNERYFELERAIKDAEEADTNIQNIKEACNLVKNNLENLSYEEKRFALEALKIKITIEGDTPRLSGFLPVNIVKHSTISAKWRCS